MPCDSKFAIVAGPKRSLPTFATMPTVAPHRRAATAWLAPLPPKPRSNFLPKMVSPGRGNTSWNVVRSTLALPTTAIKDSLAIISPLVILGADYIRTRPGTAFTLDCQTNCRARWPGVGMLLRRFSSDALDIFPNGSTSSNSHNLRKLHDNQGSWSGKIKTNRLTLERSRRPMFVPHTFGIALLMIFTSAICWGSWANTYKGVKNYRFELFYWDYALGIFLIAVALAFTMGNTANDASSFLNNIRAADRSNFIYTLAGGAVFNLANLLLVAAIDMAGLAIAFPVSIGIAMVVGVVSSYMLQPKGNAALLAAGVACAVSAVILDGQAYRNLTRAARSVSRKSILVSVVSGILMGLWARSE